MACHAACGFMSGSRPSTRAQGEGQLPLSNGAEMDAKTIRGLILLAVLSLFCATVAWAVDHAVFGAVFAALGAAATLSAAPWLILKRSPISPDFD
jgi:hypothetical protein